MEIAKEKKIVKLMIQIYSEGHDKKPLNENQKMQELLDYAYFRLDKCPFKDNKKFCSKCKVHCYKPEMRQQIKNVMRYAGPRMLFKHPILLFKHMLQKGE
jgi:hypothetical protein